MQLASRGSVGILGALCAIAVSADFVTHDSYSAAHPVQENQRVKTARESTIMDAAIARISAESQGTFREPSIEAAPRSSETPTAVDQTVPGSRPTPPGGYSFVSYFGEMSQAGIESEFSAGGERAGADLEWLEPTTSIETLARRAAVIAYKRAGGAA